MCCVTACVCTCVWRSQVVKQDQFKQKWRQRGTCSITDEEMKTQVKEWKRKVSASINREMLSALTFNFKQMLSSRFQMYYQSFPLFFLFFFLLGFPAECSRLLSHQGWFKFETSFRIMNLFPSFLLTFPETFWTPKLWKLNQTDAFNYNMFYTCIIFKLF